MQNLSDGNLFLTHDDVTKLNALANSLAQINEDQFHYQKRREVLLKAPAWSSAWFLMWLKWFVAMLLLCIPTTPLIYFFLPDTFNWLGEWLGYAKHKDSVKDVYVRSFLHLLIVNRKEWTEEEKAYFKSKLFAVLNFIDLLLFFSMVSIFSFFPALVEVLQYQFFWILIFEAVIRVWAVSKEKAYLLDALEVERLATDKYKGREGLYQLKVFLINLDWFINSISGTGLAGALFLWNMLKIIFIVGVGNFHLADLAITGPLYFIVISAGLCLSNLIKFISYGIRMVSTHTPKHYIEYRNTFLLSLSMFCTSFLTGIFMYAGMAGGVQAGFNFIFGTNIVAPGLGIFSSFSFGAVGGFSVALAMPIAAGLLLACVFDYYMETKKWDVQKWGFVFLGITAVVSTILFTCVATAVLASGIWMALAAFFAAAATAMFVTRVINYFKLDKDSQADMNQAKAIYCSHNNGLSREANNAITPNLCNVPNVTVDVHSPLPQGSSMANGVATGSNTSAFRGADANPDGLVPSSVVPPPPLLSTCMAMQQQQPSAAAQTPAGLLATSISAVTVIQESVTNPRAAGDIPPPPRV